MSKDLNRVFIKRYTWLTDNEPIEGVALMCGNIFRGFIPFSEVYRLSDKMVDLLEQHELQKDKAN